MENLDIEFIQPFTKILNTLNSYGWTMSPHMIGRDFQKVKALCEQIETNPPTSGEEKSYYQNNINQLLTTIIFHPLTRSFFIYRAQELKYISKFSHHIEKSIMHYFKNDYFSAVHCLLPAIEGSLLAYIGWQYGTSRKPSIKVLIEEIEKCRKPMSRKKEYQLYSTALARFLKNWIFTDTNTADMSLSYLNRNYVLHGMGNDNYYSLSDCQRLIVFFDLFIEFLSLEQGKRYAFIPEKNEKINSRETYYFRLLSYDLRKREMMKTEEILMKEHSFYFHEHNATNWNSFLKTALKEHLNLMKELKEFRKKKL